MLHEWKLDGVHRNLGDALSPLLATQEQIDDPNNMYFVIGSVICNQVIRETLEQGLKPVFQNCGWRGEALKSNLANQCIFDGVRGPDTQKELERVGIQVEVTGDPAYKVPALIPKASNNNLRIAVPHIQDPKRYSYNSIELGVDQIVQAQIEDDEHLIRTVQLISGASFVFAGAMHAAIIAHAYGVPFGLMNNGYVNAPSKWYDWSQGAGLPLSTFYENAKNAETWWNQNVK